MAGWARLPAAHQSFEEEPHRGPVIDRATFLPVGQYEDGSLTFAWPGFLKDAYEGAVRSYEQGRQLPRADEGGYYAGTPRAEPLDAFNAASIAPVAGVGMRAAGWRNKVRSTGEFFANPSESSLPSLMTNALEQAASDAPKGIRAYHWSPHDGYGISRDTPDEEAIRIIHQFLTDNEATLPRYVGIRVDDAAVPTGHRFEPSRVWDDGIPTEEYLPGTSGVLMADLDKGLSARDVARAWSGAGGYDGKRVRVIGSDYGERGHDAGEFVFKNGQAIFGNPETASLPYLMTNGVEEDGYPLPSFVPFK